MATESTPAAEWLAEWQVACQEITRDPLSPPPAIPGGHLTPFIAGHPPRDLELEGLAELPAIQPTRLA